jgi:hypothetical protein
MKILVIGGTHGNEPLGIDLVKKIKAKPINNVFAVLANEQAVLRNVRFIKTDLNRSFPGLANSVDYESKRAAKILLLCKKYDLVLDFHNSYSPNNDCSFVGTTAKSFLYNVSSWLGFNRVVIADYDCVNKYAPNCISLEMSMGSKIVDANFWYKKISELVKMDSIPKAKEIKKYRFVYRITLEDRDRLNLEKRSIKAFKSVNKDLANKMGVKSPAYPIFIGDKLTPYNYGGLLNEL